MKSGAWVIAAWSCLFVLTPAPLRAADAKPAFDGEWRTSFGLATRQAALLVSFLDVLGLTLLLVRVLVLVASRHVAPPNRLSMRKPRRQRRRDRGNSARNPVGSAP